MKKILSLFLQRFQKVYLRDLELRKYFVLIVFIKLNVHLILVIKTSKCYVKFRKYILCKRYKKKLNNQKIKFCLLVFKIKMLVLIRSLSFSKK